MYINLNLAVNFTQLKSPLWWQNHMEICLLVRIQISLLLMGCKKALFLCENTCVIICEKKQLNFIIFHICMYVFWRSYAFYVLFHMEFY